MTYNECNKAIAKGKAMRIEMVRNFIVRMFGAAPHAAQHHSA